MGVELFFLNSKAGMAIVGNDRASPKLNNKRLFAELAITWAKYDCHFCLVDRTFGELSTVPDRKGTNSDKFISKLMVDLRAITSVEETQTTECSQRLKIGNSLTRAIS